MQWLANVSVRRPVFATVLMLIVCMPRGIEQSITTRLDPGATAALFVALNGPLPLREMTELADGTVRSQIENVSGVGEVVVLGGRERQVNVWLDLAGWLGRFKKAPSEPKESLVVAAPGE